MRLAAVPGRPAAAYFTLHGGSADTVLSEVRTPQAERSEMHDNMTMGAMTTMTPLRRVPLPAGATIAFAPGGRHVMLFGVSPDVRAGGTMALRVGFAGQRPVAVTARVVGAADPAP